MGAVRIKSALISVFNKDGLENIVRLLDHLDVRIFSTGGTMAFVEDQGVPVTAVESLTSYPSILDGRVKTLHPQVFGGILARREEGHRAQLTQYDIPEIDLVIVDLYPFEDTVKSTQDENAIIEKIDIGGIAMIRAAAKNFNDVTIVASKAEYPIIQKVLEEGNGEITREQRKHLATRAFSVSSHYDTQIHAYFAGEDRTNFKQSLMNGKALRYGENPHQQAVYYGDLEEIFDKLQGKALSFNNLVDVDGAVQIMREFKDDFPTFAVLKHTNACGVATRNTVLEAWEAALASDPVSAFGGILISNSEIDEATAQAVDAIFYEVLIAPSFSQAALAVLSKKKKRILLRLKEYPAPSGAFKSILNGVIAQDADLTMETPADLTVITKVVPTESQVNDLLFANKCAKHLKSNTIALVANRQLIGMGCGQTSRVDALKQAILKAKSFGFDLGGSVMASDAFFPFSDCVEIGHKAGVKAVIQPGGSIRDNDSIEFCDAHGMAMVTTGVRHFKH